MAAEGKDKEKVPVTEILEEDDEFEVRRRRLGDWLFRRSAASCEFE